MTAPTRVPLGVVAVGALLALVAIGAGVLAVRSPGQAAALIGGIAFVLLALRNLTLGFCAFLPLLVVERIPGAPTESVTYVKIAGAALVLVALAHVLRRRGKSTLLHPESRVVAGAAVLLLAWAGASVLWAPDKEQVLEDGLRLMQGMLLVFVAVVAIREARHLSWLVWAFVGGTLLTMVVGLGGSSSQGGLLTATTRLTGGVGDANELAAVLVVAVTLAAFMAGHAPTAIGRWGLLAAAILLALGIVLSQSRGALIAVAVVVAATVLFGGEARARVLSLGAGLFAVGMSLVLLVAPDAVRARLIDFSLSGSSGRSDLWSIAIRVIEDHPVTGVGLGNFVVVEPGYATRNVNLPNVARVLDVPHVVHNTYLHVFTELGVVGVLLFVVVVAAAFRCALLAARRFRAAGDARAEACSRAIAVALAGAAGAFVFLSAQYEKSLWLLIGASVASAAIAHGRAGRESPAAARQQVAAGAPRRASAELDDQPLLGTP